MSVSGRIKTTKTIRATWSEDTNTVTLLLTPSTMEKEGGAVDTTYFLSWILT